MTEQKMMSEFKLIQKTFAIAREAMYEANEAMNTIDNRSVVDEWYDEARDNLENEFFKVLRVVFRVADDDDSFYQDDWFWAEWEATDACFWFLYGCSSAARSDEQSLRWNEEQRQREEEVIAKAKKYQAMNEGKV